MSWANPELLLLLLLVPLLAVLAWATRRMRRGLSLSTARMLRPLVSPVARLVPPERRLDLVVYPDLRPADRVDWTDYETRVAGTPSAAVAADVLLRAGDGSGVWVVTGPGFRVPSSQRCGGLVDALERARGEAEPVVAPDPAAEENHRLQYLAPVA